MDWLLKIRTPYWGYSSPGDRFAALRKAKNRVEGFQGKYTLSAIAARINVRQKKLAEIETGAVPLPLDLKALILSDLGISNEVFETATDPRPRIKSGELTLAPATPPATPVRTAPVAPPSPPAQREQERDPITSIKVPAGKDFTVINYTEEPYFIRIIGRTIHIMYNEKQSKGTFVGAADMVAGKIVPRSTDVKPS